MRRLVGALVLLCLVFPATGCENEQPLQLTQRIFSFTVEARSSSSSVPVWGVFDRLWDCTGRPDGNNDGIPDLITGGPNACDPLHEDPSVAFPRCTPLGETESARIPWFFEAEVSVIRSGTAEEVVVAEEEPGLACTPFCSMTEYESDPPSLGDVLPPTLVSPPEGFPPGTYWATMGNKFPMSHRKVVEECHPDFVAVPLSDPEEERTERLLLHAPNVLQADCCREFRLPVRDRFGKCSAGDRDACKTFSTPLGPGDTVIVTIRKERRADSDFTKLNIRNQIGAILNPATLFLRASPFLDGVPVQVNGLTQTDDQNGSGMTFSYTLR